MPKRKIAFEAIGTQWTIETDSILAPELVAAIHARIELFDSTYSRFRKDSLVSQAAKTAGIYVFPTDADALFTFYETLYRLTDGKVTPLVGALLENAGYDADYSFVAKTQQKIPALYDVIDRKGSSLKISEPVVLDVGAAGKGYLVDIVCQILDDAGIDEYVVDASGDLRHKGAAENTVGLEYPFDASKVIGVIDVQNKSLCASATNRRQWGDGMHHVFDPDRMEPTNDVVATWVIADSTMVADGLATALFFAEPSKLREAFVYEYARMHANGSIDYSRAFEGQLF